VSHYRHEARSASSIDVITFLVAFNFLIASAAGRLQYPLENNHTPFGMCDYFSRRKHHKTDKPTI
jgi:hypothetical protein